VWLVYSANSSNPPAVEGYFAAGWFTLLAVLVLLQRRVTLLRGLLAFLVLLQRRVTLLGGWFTLPAVLVLLQRRVTLLGVGLLC
jgi:hypothetical protein